MFELGFRLKDVDSMTLDETLAHLEAKRRKEEREFDQQRLLFHSVVQALSQKEVKFDRYLSRKKVERPQVTPEEYGKISKMLDNARARNKV